MANLPLAFAELIAGGVILTAGLKGATIGEVVTGAAGSAKPFPGAGGATAAGTASAAASPTDPGIAMTTGAVGKVTPQLLEQIASSHGWNSQQVNSWKQVISRESGGDPTAVNSSSGAYGIAQMLAPGGSPSDLGPNMEKYSQYGGNASSVEGQLVAMANYIAQRYGDPAAAWAHEETAGWY